MAATPAAPLHLFPVLTLLAALLALGAQERSLAAGADAPPAEAPGPSVPSVRAPAGELRGRWVEAGRGAPRFAAYLGIPYAQPPVGALRFKAAPPVDPFDGVLDATRDPPVCPQVNVLSAAKEVLGQEDCLYLNVYTPEAVGGGPSRPLPVVFVVHGGRFEHGSGRLDALGPHFLLAGRDVIVVAANYRQGPLGFLSLDTEDVPGNAGLRDLVVALEWVRDNIAAFGGDAARVTAFGFSTGASAAHILSLLPGPRSLLARMVLLGGHALSPRAYSERHAERAAALAAELGAANDTVSVSAALRAASPEALLRACDQPRVRALGFPLPSPERRPGPAAGKLLPQDPESLVREPRAPPLPTLVGVAAREGSFPYTTWGLAGRSAAALDAMLPRLLPADVLPGADSARQLGLADAGRGPGPLAADAALRLAQLVRDEYADGGPIAAGNDAFIEFLGDTFLYASAWRAVDMMANLSTAEAPLHVYQFNVDDDYNYVKKLYRVSQPNASHVDDLGYLFRFDQEPDLQQDLAGQGVAPKTLRRMVKNLVQFVKGLPLDWPAARPGLSGAVAAGLLPVLHVGPGLGQRVRHEAPPHAAFWASVYRDLRAASSIGRG